MAAEDGTGSGLEAFAAANGLTFASSASLPSDGALLSEGGDVEGAVTGTLPGGLGGTLARYHYTTTSTDSDGHTTTHHHRLTIVVSRVPESIGFAPYLAYRGPGSSMGVDMGQGAKRVKMVEDAVKNGRAYAFDGTDEGWLTELFSPALLDWLGRSPAGFGFELSGGVLCVARDDFIDGGRELTGLCTDAAHVAEAVRKESIEEVDTGGAARSGAKSHALDPKLAASVEEVVGDDVPDHLGATTGEFKGHLYSSPGTYGTALLWALVVAAILNVFLLAITINLVVANQYTGLIIFEAALIGICFIFALRWRVRDQAKQLDPEAFFRGYARSRHLELVDPLQFAATHAEAKLPFKPDRVFTGALPGGSGDEALALKGDGTTREDAIAVVAGPTGPIAFAELTATAPGLSVANLDEYSAALSKQLAQQAPQQPAST